MEQLLGFYTLVVVFLLVVYLSFKVPHIWNVLLLAFFARAGLLIYNYYGVQFLEPGFDAETFEKVAWLWAQDGVRGIPQHFTTGAPIYSWFISIFYIFLDRSPMMIQGINILFGILNVLLAYKLSLALDPNKKTAKRVAWVVAFFPTALYFSIVILREEITIFLLLFNILHFLSFLEKPKIISFVIILTTLLALVALHTAFLILPAFFLMGLLLRIKKRATSQDWIILVFAVLFITGSFFFIKNTGWGMDKAGQESIFDIGMYGKQQQIAARDRAAYLPDIYMENRKDLFMQLPIRIVYFLFSPFVWQIKESKDVLGVLDGLIYLLMVVVGLVELKTIVRNSRAKIILFLTGAIISVFSLVTSNYGTAIRHRFKVSILLIVLFMIVVDGRKRIKFQF